MDNKNFNEENNLKIHRGESKQKDNIEAIMESENRKQQSIDILKKSNIPYIEHLPRIESSFDIKPRTIEEIARRALACLMAIQVACDINTNSEVEHSRQAFKERLKIYSVENELTEAEKVIFDGVPTQQEAINMAWKYEAYWVLIWALGFVDELEYPSDICDCQYAINVVISCNDLNEFLQEAKLRNIHEILDEADLIYRYNWACVNARLKKEEAPEDLNSSVVYERHWALNWLIGKDTHNDEWDFVSTDT